jgi:hypothetical protein
MHPSCPLGVKTRMPSCTNPSLVPGIRGNASSRGISGLHPPNSKPSVVGEIAKTGRDLYDSGEELYKR